MVPKRFSLKGTLMVINPSGVEHISYGKKTKKYKNEIICSETELIKSTELMISFMNISRRFCNQEYQLSSMV